MNTTPACEIIPVSVRMSDYGYWVVTLSIRPGTRSDVMIAVTGISPTQAIDAALASYRRVRMAGNGQ